MMSVSTWYKDYKKLPLEENVLHTMGLIGNNIFIKRL